MPRFELLALCVYSAMGQNPGTLKQERQPTLTVQSCTTANGCKTEKRSVVLDANWRWLHEKGGMKNCYNGQEWDRTVCPDGMTCAKNCELEGADEEYTNTYGIHTNGADLRLDFVTQGQYSRNVGSRVYLMEEESRYKMFKLKNKEFTFDVDVSHLPCGLNGALYFVSMESDGGMNRYPTNRAGAKYGTGYCDAQCPHDVKFIHGEANVENWGGSSTDGNSGAGRYGACCHEFDVWEANSRATMYTAHACSMNGLLRCQGIACGDGEHRFDGVCDKNGCDFHTYRLGDQAFFGEGSEFAVDTTKPVRVVTQFITEDGTDTGDLVEIRRYYKQGDTIVHNPNISVGGRGPYDSLKKEFCEAELAHFQDRTNFLEKGGFKAMDDAFTEGMVLTLSIWDDHASHMLWLDSTFPVDSRDPGAARGPCATTSGKPADVESQHPDAFVTYYNIKYGEIGSTDVGPVSASDPAPSQGASAGRSPALGTSNCCWGGNTCAAVTDCHVDNYCGASQSNCEKQCSGTWCPDRSQPSLDSKPSPQGGCSGGLSACIDGCADDLAEFKACVKSCQALCSKHEL